MNMPKVTQCEVEECAYNTDSECHAMAITIGDSSTPQCDTFCDATSKGGDPASIANVGACKTSACQYNKQLECMLRSISVGWKDDAPDCLSFRKR
jgi:hypothetical protein